MSRVNRRADGRRAGRMAAAAAGLGVALGLGGCSAVNLQSPNTFAPPIMLGAAYGAAGVVSAEGVHGPKVTVFNRSGVPVEVRLWVARVHFRSPSGFVEQRTGDHLVTSVPAGERARLDAGRKGWTDGASDAVVWVRLEWPGDGSGEPGGGVAWFELERPGPYRVVAVRRDEGAGLSLLSRAYHADSVARVRELPRSMWLEEHDGVFATGG